ncbi:hypothetical protein BJY01DRAFT_260143 [Aspergillus pseudoustus]|uniref:DUF7136 domain-containing protein n=1 Tax=Aspergillus pseudoustus TaxID=1810923 RepID=A0ABR4KIG3_9EURO
MARLLPTIAAACLALITPVLGISYPTTIEVDLIFPRNETYDNMTGFPIVFALQNADAAGTFGWNIDWEFVWLDGDEDEKFLDSYSGPWITDSTTLNDFRYIGDDAMLLAGRVYHENGYYLRPGTYAVYWTYDTAICYGSGRTTYIDGGYTVATASLASERLIFTVVADGSGLGFEIPVGECPAYAGQWTAKSGTATDCPNNAANSTAEPDPCAAQISQDQISCLQDWFGGSNESEVCTSSLERWDVLGESGEASGVGYLCSHT